MRFAFSITCALLATGCHLLIETGDSSQFKPAPLDFELTLRDVGPPPQDSGQATEDAHTNLDAKSPGPDGSDAGDAQPVDAQQAEDMAVAAADMSLEIDAAMSVPCTSDMECRDGEACQDDGLCAARTCVNCQEGQGIECVYGCCQQRVDQEGSCVLPTPITLGPTETTLNVFRPDSHMGQCAIQPANIARLRPESFFSFTPERDGQYCLQIKPPLSDERRASIWVFLRLGCCMDNTTEFECLVSTPVTPYPKIQRVLHAGVTYTVGIGISNPQDNINYELREGECTCATDIECDAGWACNEDGSCENREAIACQFNDDCGRLQDCVDGRCVGG
jgi:hypothetical protein